MYRVTTSPVREITLGAALKISLDTYYDVLKQQTADLKADERLQLKLVASTIDISDDKKASEHGYKWFSYYNLVTRSDRAISPSPVDDEIQVGLESLASVYGQFIRKIRKYVTQRSLSAADETEIANIESKIELIKYQSDKFAASDYQRWQTFAPSRGIDVGDMAAYVQWSNKSGHLRDIEQLDKDLSRLTFDKQTIIKRATPDPTDQSIIDAEFRFEGPAMRLRYPIYPDYEYPNGDSFNPVYLQLLATGTTALFDDRWSIAFDKTLGTIKTGLANALTGSLNRQTQASSSITTDWSGSASASYGPFSASASASEHTQIQSDFTTVTDISISSTASYRIELNIPWMDATLFNHKYVRDNPHDFLEFFGSEGSLLYYPTALIVIRGFQISFLNSQNWTFDYQRKFSVKGGGGFKAFGVRFGGSGSYTRDEKEHKVDVSGTKLTIGDDTATIRFVGYALKKNKTVSAEIAVAASNGIFSDLQYEQSDD
ncbi:hypothetical protein [Sphingomonas sp. CFBP9019]|uniref:hypothetical protein n=1 Tax=Sphingomonas sp. CFBP9019 TaxID=3096532 RepID=UPI002A6A27D0|nr:hypothetical protein [Sphingomonas sp. CFBP9019]MDY1010350.1 hypothetical protein [Sphingomonas sp. CFBP9019]